MNRNHSPKDVGEESNSFHCFKPRVSFSDITMVTTFQEADAGIESSFRSMIQSDDVLPLESPVAALSCKVYIKGKDDRIGQEIDLEEVLRQTVENQQFVAVENLSWRERSYPHREGRYTGMVNKEYCPNGAGVLILDSPKSFQTSMNIICGTWFNGSFITDRWKEDIFSEVIQKIKEYHYHHNNEAIESTSKENFKTHHISKSNESRRRNRYKLGEILQSDHEIIQEKSMNAEMLNKLQVNDYAFIKRTDQSWTYALLVKRCFIGGQHDIESGKEKSSGLECRSNECEVMIFALDNSGQRTKTFTKKKWAKYVKCESVGLRSRLRDDDHK